MTPRPSPEAFLRARGLEPLGWDAVLARLEARLGAEDAAAFARLHRAFAAYPAEHTCRAFYDFAARRDLTGLLACYRFDRLRALIETIGTLEPAESALRGARVLDAGAGSGTVAAWLRDVRGAAVAVTDLSPAAAARLEAAGFLAPAPGAVFDRILCADSLGEIHADEDDWLADPAHADDPEYPGELEARYGFAAKLAALAPRLAPGGTVLLFEPVEAEHFWRGAARALEAAGWNTEVLAATPARGLRLTRPRG